MMEITTFRRNKVDLSDYDYSKDIFRRLAMAQFNQEEVEALEEILFSSLTISLNNLASTLSLSKIELFALLEKLGQTGLFKIVRDELHVDKELRKYFELQLKRFEEGFTPDIDFLQGLLRQVPIHVLPNWYAIPRSSNNIFDSIIEKYLITPQIFQRHLMELNFTDPVQRQIMSSVFRLPHFEISVSDLMNQFRLSREQLEEHLLYLEFNFICSTFYKKERGIWKAFVTPFHEWKEYLQTMHSAQSVSIQDPSSVVRKKTSDFAFVEELSILLQFAQNQSLVIERTKEELLSLQAKTCKILVKECPEISKADLPLLLTKACLLELAQIKDDFFSVLPGGNQWLEMNIPERALLLYRHPNSILTREDLSEELLNEKIFHEIEKNLTPVLKSGWVYLEDFLQGALVPIHEEQAIQLKKIGRGWKYHLPRYTAEELELLRAVVCEWLFESGITALGTHKDRECFCVTAFGQDLLGDE